MPSNKAARYLQHIVTNAQAIFRYTEGMEFAQFRLGDNAEELMPGQPWQRIRGFGNRLRHNYDSIEEDRLFDVVRNDLPALLAHTQAALEKLLASEGGERT